MAGSLKYLHLQKELLKKAEEAARRKKEAETEVNRVSEIMKIAREKEISLTEVEGIAQDIQKIYSEGEYVKVAELIHEFKKKASPLLKEVVERDAAVVKENVNIARLSGITVSENVHALFEHIEKGEYADAFALVDGCREGTARLLREEATGSIQQAEQMLPLVPDLGGDPERFSQVIVEAKRFIEEGLVSDALGRVSAVMSSITLLAQEEVGRISEEIERVIPMAEENGVPLTEPQAELEKARQCLKKREVSLALTTARGARDAARERLGGVLDKIKATVDRSYASGREIDADLTKVDRLLAKAEEHSGKGDALGAARYYAEALRSLEGICLNTVMDRMNRMKAKFILARKLKADIKAPMELLKRARDAVGRKEYRTALGHIEECDEKINAIVGEYDSLRADLDALGNEVKEAAGLGADVSKIEPRIDITRDLLGEKDFAKVRTLLVGIRRDVDKLLSNVVVGMMEAGERAVQYGERIGMDTSAFTGELRRATTLMESGDYKKSIETARKAIAAIKKDLDAKVEETLLSIESEIEALPEERKTELKKIYEEVEKAVKKGEDETVWERTAFLVAQIESESSQNLNKVLRQAREYLDVLSGIKGKDQVLEKRYDLAIEKMGAKQYRAALTIAKDLISEVKRDESEMAEHAFNSAKDILVDVRKKGADIQDLRPILQSARKALDSQDFKTSIEESMRCRALALRKAEVFQNAYDAISSAAMLVAEAKMKGLDVRSVAKTLIRAKDTFKARKYEDARKLAVESRSTVERMLIEVKAKEEVERLKNVVSVGVEGGLDMDAVSTRLREVEEAVSAGDPLAALEMVKKIDEETGRIFLEKANDILNETMTLITEVEKTGISIAGIKDMTVRASQAIIENDAFEAFHYATVARKEVLRIKDVSLKASSIIKSSYERINEAEGYHGDTSAAKAYLNQAVKFFKLGDFEKAVEFGEKSVEEAEIAEMRLLTRVISDVHGMISSSKKEGINTALAENMLTQAKTALDEKRFKEALSLAMKAESELERVGMQMEMASTTITVTETKIKKMREEGFTSKEADTLLEEAKQMYESGDYIHALEIAIQGSEVLNRSSEAFNEVKKGYSDMLAMAEMLSKCRVDLGDLQKEVEDVKGMFTAGEYVRAKDAVSNLTIKLTALGETHASEISSYCSWFMDFSATLGIDTQSVKRFFEEGVSYLERGLVDQGLNSMRSLFLILEPGVVDALNLAMEELQNRLDGLKARGADTSEAEASFSGAKEGIASGRFKDAHEAILSCYAQVETLLGTLPEEAAPAASDSEGEAPSEEGAAEVSAQGPAEEIERLRAEIDLGREACRKFGFPTKTIDDITARCSEMEKAGDMDGLLSALREGAAEVEKVLSKVTPSVSSEYTLPEKIEADTPIDVRVKVKNTSKAAAKDVSLVFEVGSERVSGEIDMGILKGGAEEERSVRLTFKRPGEMEVTLRTVYHRIFDGKRYESLAPRVASVSRAKVRDFTRAESTHRCVVCKGMIKKGFMMFQCECGSALHEPCAIRRGKCPSCERQVPKKKTKAKLALTFG